MIGLPTVWRTTPGYERFPKEFEVETVRQVLELSYYMAAVANPVRVSAYGCYKCKLITN